MERKTAHDFDQELLTLFDAYVHGALDRRGFLDKAAEVRRSAASPRRCCSISSARSSPRRRSSSPDDARSRCERVEYPLAEGLRQDARLPGAAGEGRGQAAGASS